MSYRRFGAMIASSTAVMFVLMYLNTYAWEHVFFSETRVYMAILMGASMAVVMLAFMIGMYRNATLNVAIFVGSAVVFALSLWLVRSQATVSGVSYMRAMIPHHSIAIMTSERAQIRDPRVRKLADEIIDAQRREIAEMRYLVAQLEGNGDSAPPEAAGHAQAEVGTVSRALSTALVPRLDPAPLKAAEAARVLGSGPGCRFQLTREGDPILVVRPTSAAGRGAQGVMKLNGVLVPLPAGDAGDLGKMATGVVLSADGVRMSVGPSAEGDTDALGRSNASLVFELERDLTVGYRGFYACDSSR